ncbi:MAG TPA: hypothetical protein P5294_05925 [Smithellaceae bacterium]|nr:hypothetical protein [Smithellaceae bacterium]HRS89985.1 hypothetical protein [Smithellaceae bacterium]HRV26054.1 hypothetical protein [Smithellaceae bacterium]
MFKKRVYSMALVLISLLFLLKASAAAADTAKEDECEKKKGLVILVEFPYVIPKVDDYFVRDRFKQLNNYVREMSYGKVCAEFDFTGWHKLPDSIKQYSISDANLQVDKSRIVKLIQDSIDAADEENDFSRYSFIVLFLSAKFEEYGMIGLCGYPGMLGWSQDIVFKTKKKGQVVPGGVAIFTYQAHLGTLFHDVAHVWGGVRDGKRVVPCLYDHDIQAQHPTLFSGWAKALINMGYWDPMSCHLYQRHLPPPGISSWTKLRLGWIAPEKIKIVEPKQTAEIVLGPLEDGASDTLVIKIPLTKTTFYLIENRQPLGDFDAHLPGKGILIMYADDTVAECRHGRAPVKLMDANPSVSYLQGAAYDLPDQAVFIDKERGVEIKLLEKTGDAYKIRVSRK